MQVVPSWRDERYLNIRSTKPTDEQIMKHIDMMEGRVVIEDLHERMYQWLGGSCEKETRM